jgi:cytochrome c peroxidase
MKDLLIVTCLFSAAFVFFSCNRKPAVRNGDVRQTLLTQLDSFAAEISSLEAAAKSSNISESQLQEQFLRCRMAFKKTEWAVAYFQPASSRAINGPPVPEVEMPYLQVIEPSGLQVIETYIFPGYDSSRIKDLLNQLNILQANRIACSAWIANNELPEFQVFEAARLELFRIMTLGITGFDNPLTLKSMQESAAALESLQYVFEQYKDSVQDENPVTQLKNAVEYLRSNPDFNSFNRMEFITGYCNPVSRGIVLFRNQLKIRYYKYNRLLSQDALTLFDSGAFNVNAYAPDHSSFITKEKVDLGKKLFSDPVLSGNGSRSCASCHQPGQAFTDGLAKNTEIGSSLLLERNTPTLINAALQPALFYDLRVRSLEDQSHAVVHSKKEMQGSMTRIAGKLWQDSHYRQMFQTAFPNSDKSRIDTFEIMNAIGSFIRSLTFLNSPFDEYMRGNTSLLQADEIRGFNLFMGKARCATCHYLPLFNGNLPPGYVNMETEVIGVPGVADQKEIDGDLGKYSVVPVASLRHAFKIPTVRNAALTAPYMHNGVFSSLEQVLDFYNRGGGAGLGFKLDNQTLPADSLRLSSSEQEDIISFIRSLNSKMPADKN